MVRRAVLFLAICAACHVRAQDTTMFRGAGLLRGSATIAPGFPFNASATNNYIGGKLEYFPDERFSFRGESFWLTGAREGSPMEQSSQIGFGPFLHFGRDRLDMCLGFETGVSLARPALTVTGQESDPLRVLPNVSLCTGLTYSVWDYFHFFLDARLTHASYTGSVSGSIPLDELIIGGGMGWQLRLRR